MVETGSRKSSTSYKLKDLPPETLEELKESKVSNQADKAIAQRDKPPIANDAKDNLPDKKVGSGGNADDYVTPEVVTDKDKV